MTLPLLHMKGVAKRFTLHHQNGAELSVLHNVDLEVRPGECLVLEDGNSGLEAAKAAGMQAVFIPRTLR